MENLLLYGLLIVLGLAFSSSLLVFAYGSTLKVTLTLLGLFVLVLLSKIPDRFSHIGGTDLGMALMILVANSKGALMGILFGVGSVLIGAKLINEPPQNTFVSSIIHAIVAVLASYIALTEGNLLLFSMLFILAGHAIGSPIYILMGNPPQTQLLFVFVNILWDFVILRNFGVLILSLLAG